MNGLPNVTTFNSKLDMEYMVKIMQKHNRKSELELAWHYTTGENFVAICDSKYIKPAKIGVLPPEKPIVWFSTHKHYEPTARKMKMDGSIASVDELFLLGRGLVRFGLPVNRLIHWNKLKSKARMHESVAKRLEDIGRDQGADPQQWHGLLKKVSIEECVRIDVMDNNKQWVRVR